MMRKALLILGAALALSGRPAAADAQTLVDRQLNTVSAVLALRGWERVEDFRGYLPQMGRGWANIRFRGGSQYVVVGACDQDCADLDLALVDGSEHLVAINIGADDLPYVGIESPRRSLHTVNVSMAPSLIV